MGLAKVSLNDKYALDTTRAYLNGIEALVRLPMLQHQRDLMAGLNTAGFISGYRGSPLGGLDQALWKAETYLQRHNIHFQPGINEDLAATAVWGSQQVNLFPGAKYDGVFGMWYGKGPGVDRSMDVIRHANAFGTSKYGGVLAVAGDDHACKSSTLPHQTEHMFIGVSMPVLNPASVQEVLDLGVFGWELSRYSGCWVALKAITENMDSSISAQIDPSRVEIVIPDDFELPADGVHARWPDPPLEQERRLNKFKIYAARHFAYANRLNRIVLDSEKPRLGIITTGKAYLDVMQALEDLGIDEREAARIGLRVFKLGMSWPLEPIATHEFARGLEEILVVEEKRSIVEDQLTGQLYNWPVAERPRVFGEFDEHGNDLLPNLGELTPARVARAIASRIDRFHTSKTIRARLQFLEAKEERLAEPRGVLARLPHYCSGCPHNTSTKLPAGSRGGAGIGCHYMVTWMDRETHTFTQMGGEGATWIGQAPFTETSHVFQNLGDGTYFHSGLLAIRAAISSGVNITYKILYNDAVAMTGGQPVDGTISVTQIIHQLRGEGVKRIAVVSDEPDKYPADFPVLPGSPSTIAGSWSVFNSSFARYRVPPSSSTTRLVPPRNAGAGSADCSKILRVEYLSTRMFARAAVTAASSRIVFRFCPRKPSSVENEPSTRVLATRITAASTDFVRVLSRSSVDDSRNRIRQKMSRASYCPNPTSHPSAGHGMSSLPGLAAPGC